MSGTSNIFEGKPQYKRFNRILSKVIDDNASKFLALGVIPSDFGTYSIFKCAATYVTKECTVFPPKPSICLCENWTLGGVKDR